MRMSTSSIGIAFMAVMVGQSIVSQTVVAQIINKPPAQAAPPGVGKADTEQSPTDTEKENTKDGSNQSSSVETRKSLSNRASDEESIRHMSETFVKAYNQGNARLVGDHFTDDAEYVDDTGNCLHGRREIEESLQTFFADNPDCALEIDIDTIRFVSPAVAVEDGTSRTHREGEDTPAERRYTAVYVKTNGKWFAASVREHVAKPQKQHRDQLEQLKWLLGDWIDEGDESIVHFSCRPVDGGNFFLRTFTIHIAGQEAMTGTQRIGWDPLSGRLRVWIFDSAGAYGEGFWHRDGSSWVLKVTGVTADGQSVSSTSIYEPINGHTMTWRFVDYEVGGVRQPDSDIFTVVRLAPAPSVESELK